MSIIFGVLEVGLPLEELLRSQRSRLHRDDASGAITLVAIDDASLKEVGRYPWPRRHLAKLVTELDRLGANRIFINNLNADPTEEADDLAFEEALRPLGRRVVLPVAFGVDPVTGEEVEIYPLPRFSKNAQLAHINSASTPFGTVRRLTFEERFKGRSYPSFAALLGNQRGQGDFRIDYSVDQKTIPKVSAVDIIKGRASPTNIRGSDVVIGTSYQPLSDAFFEPTSGPLPGSYLWIFGAETLRQGVPQSPSWLWPFLFAVSLCTVCLALNRRTFSICAIGGAIGAALIVPLPLEMNHIFIDTMAALFLLVVVGVGFSWTALRQMYRARGMTNLVSGLPNLTALHQQTVGVDRPLVAARVHNYAAIVATLSVEGEKALVEQVTNRLMIGASDPTVYQGDEGIFAWFAGPGTNSIGAHLDALHTLFQSPVIAQGSLFDLVITFGFDGDDGRLTPNRLASALVAAEDAHKEGLRWKEHDSAGLEDSAWRLSLLSQLDAAIDSGDFWVAYQPKLDLATNRIIGAEALARWTHADKGPINPIEFILAAEQSNRIEKLTDHVLEQAIRVAVAINDRRSFNMSVNLSARLIDDPKLVGKIKTLLAKHGLAPEHLTLEVTETAALGDSTRSLENLRQLRAIGVLLSVDDYGTGMSTLEYLQRIPATEIKIDRSFVAGMRANHATKVMVNSTIQLAHSLGQKVVAEGVEDEETLKELRMMHCDLAQGYLIGRPMTFRSLTKALDVKKEHAA